MSNPRPGDTLLRLGDDVVVVKTERTNDSQPQLYVAVSAAKQLGAPLNTSQVRVLRDTLTGWLDRLEG